MTVTMSATTVRTAWQGPPLAAGGGNGNLDGLPYECTVMKDGQLPTCTSLDGENWTVSYPGGGSGPGGAFAALFVLVLLLVVGFTIYRVSLARQLARRSGLSEGEATVMTLIDDDGLSATYLASALRPPPAAAPPAHRPADNEQRPPARSAADRLRDLQDLAAQGLITDAEYEARRQLVIGEL